MANEGLVPAPKAGDQDNFLSTSGWSAASSSKTFLSKSGWKVGNGTDLFLKGSATWGYMTALQYSFSFTITTTSSPAGSKYTTDEVVTWRVRVRNTGSVDITNLIVRADTTGVTYESGTGYTSSGVTATIQSLAASAYIDLTAKYTIKSTDRGKSDFKVTFVGTKDAISESGSTPVVPIYVATPTIPTTQAAFNNLTWEQLEVLSAECAAASSTTAYQGMLGFTKSVNTPYGKTNVVLAGLKHDKPSASGDYYGFTFMFTQGLVETQYSTSSTAMSPYSASKPRTLCTTIYNGLDNDLKAVIKTSYIRWFSKCPDSSYSDSTETVSYSGGYYQLYVPAASDFSRQTYFNEAYTQLSGITSGKVSKSVTKIGTSTACDYWYRTQQTTTNVNTGQILHYYVATSKTWMSLATDSYWVVPLFAI